MSIHGVGGSSGPQDVHFQGESFDQILQDLQSQFQSMGSRLGIDPSNPQEFIDKIGAMWGDRPPSTGLNNFLQAGLYDPLSKMQQDLKSLENLGPIPGPGSGMAQSLSVHLSMFLEGLGSVTGQIQSAITNGNLENFDSALQNLGYIFSEKPQADPTHNVPSSNLIVQANGALFLNLPGFGTENLWDVLTYRG